MKQVSLLLLTSVFVLQFVILCDYGDPWLVEDMYSSFFFILRAYNWCRW